MSRERNIITFDQNIKTQNRCRTVYIILLLNRRLPSLSLEKYVNTRHKNNNKNQLYLQIIHTVPDVGYASTVALNGINNISRQFDSRYITPFTRRQFSTVKLPRQRCIVAISNYHRLGPALKRIHFENNRLSMSNNTENS